ncbi:hypothetical protein [Aeromonas veronii]|uniref:hypothetical protein n=1 Tax=Aeromonas veronii TaxID=654 RepID=UPI003BA11909
MTFISANGTPIAISSALEQLKIEHVLQRDRDVWVVCRTSPYLAINEGKLRSRIEELTNFPVFSSGILFHNISGKDVGRLMISALFGGGADAGIGLSSQVLVQGRANAKANALQNFNAPLCLGSSPFCAEGTSFIFVEAQETYQYKIGDLITVNKKSRPTSVVFDFSELGDRRDAYFDLYEKGKQLTEQQLADLTINLDRIFELNQQSLLAMEKHHREAPPSTNKDYDAPVLTKYDRLVQTAQGDPRIEVAFSLLHYEKALFEFHSLKISLAQNKKNDALLHGVYCIVAAAACIEAVANKLVYLQTNSHPDHRDRRQPLQKINDAARWLANSSGDSFLPLRAGDPIFDALDKLRVLRNGFMHAKEAEMDIEPSNLMSTLASEVSEDACRQYLMNVRLGVQHVYAQLTGYPAPIVTEQNRKWLGDLEVP